MSNKDRVLSILEIGPLCDDCLSDKSGVRPRQSVNMICREADKQGIIRRNTSTCPSCRSNKILNYLTGVKPAHPEEFIQTVEKPGTEKRWYWEGNVQHRIVDYLVSQGYSILRVADTGTREAGVDIKARSQSGKQLLVSVKGYPDKSSNVQARHWFAETIFDIVRYRQEYPDVDLAIGLPAGFATYENLALKVSWLRDTAPFLIFWVHEDGSVYTE